MTTTSSSIMRASRGATVIVGLVLLGAALAACSSSPNSGTTATTSPPGTTATTGGTGSGTSALNKLESLSSSVQAAEKKTFKAVYTITNASSTQTVTIEQSPPKSLFSTKSGSVIDTGTTSYYCSNSGTITCVSTGTTNPLAALTAVFSPATILAGLKAAQTEAAAHAAGYNVSFSSGTYAGQDTTCANLSSSGNSVKYCVTGQGVLAYASSNGGSFALTSYSSSPPASDFSIPAGATVETIPSGL
ncbi:MAG TPA: hypothetical protein VN796_12365 [Acidimicrobiales bacterium]|nr:hypothetical protein [Acidimicrobiales bacterium]